MSSRFQPCRCGTAAPPSVSVAASECCLWQAILECPCCGLLAVSSGPDAIHSLLDAALKWNALAAARTLYSVPRPRPRPRPRREN